MMQQAPSSVAMLLTSRNFHHGRGVIFRDGTETRAMIGVRQIVINRLGHADDAHFVIPLHRFLVNFVWSVLRIVPARVEKVADVVRLKNFEQAIHVFGGLFGLLIEIDLVTAGAERRAGRVFEPFDRSAFSSLMSISSSLRIPRMPLSPP